MLFRFSGVCPPSMKSNTSLNTWKTRDFPNPVGNIPITFFLKQTKASTISFLLRLHNWKWVFSCLCQSKIQSSIKKGRHFDFDNGTIAWEVQLARFWLRACRVSQSLRAESERSKLQSCGTNIQSSFLNTTCAQLIQRPELLNNHLSLNLNNAKVISPIYNPKQGSKVIFFTWKKYFWNALIKSI